MLCYYLSGNVRRTDANLQAQALNPVVSPNAKRSLVKERRLRDLSPGSER